MASLTRRTFEGGPARLASFNWVARHVRELALAAAEHPRLLPFLQLVSRVDGPPVETFERAVREAGITPSARRKLERWGYEPFSLAMEVSLTNDAIETLARFANLLDRLEIHEPPDPMFVELALRGGIDSVPDWFLRTLHKEFVIAGADLVAPGAADAAMVGCPIPEGDFDLLAIWLNTNPPLPDPHQQQSWPWIIDQAWRHRALTDAAAREPWPVPSDTLYRALTDAAAREPWPVPSDTLSIAGYDVVPLRCAL